jgi:hypothetical protein
MLAFFYIKKLKTVDTNGRSVESYFYKGGLMIRAIIFEEWIRRIDQLLDFCLERKAESFEGVFWEKLYEAGYKPLEVAMALIEEYYAASQEEMSI